MTIKKISAAVFAAMAWLTSGSAAAEVKIGDAAPAFSLPGSDGKTHVLKDALEGAPVVLAWFPKAATPG